MSNPFKSGNRLTKPAKASIIIALCIFTVGVAFSVSRVVFADEPTSTPADLPDTVEPESLDDIYGRIATDIPSFAGMYMDGETLFINVTDQSPSLEASALSAIEENFGLGMISDKSIVYKRVKYGYNQLREWYRPFLDTVYTFNEVALTDIDETNNRLKVGIETLDNKSLIEESLETSGIPTDAIEVVEFARFQTDSLSDYTRPLMNGIRISRPGGHYCTLGLNAIRSGTLGDVINSHCTVSMGYNDGTIFSQGGTEIGTESRDPAFFTGGACPSGNRCRYSDSAYITKNASTNMLVGRIARPSSSDHSEPVDWNGTDTFRIVGEKQAIAGQTIATKVGAYTGRTIGTVSATCANASNSVSPEIRILCQGIASYSSASGDSGSPVVEVTNSPNTNDVLLLGIHWGNSGSSVVYSPIGKNNIKRSTEIGGFVAARDIICPACRNWDHYYVWRSGSQSSNKAVWWSANEFIARYDQVKYVQFNSGGGSSGWADTAYIKFCRALNSSGEPIDCIGEQYVTNINDYGTTTVTYSTPLVTEPGRKYWFSINTGGSNKVLVYYSNYGSADYTDGCNKWQDGTLHSSCSIDHNGTVEATGS